MSALLSFTNLTLGYAHHPAVHHLHAEVKAGALLALVGPNGAGKSSLLKGIAGELKPMAGSLTLHGLRRREIAYLTQQSALDASFPLTVFDLVAMGLWKQCGAFGGIGRQGRSAIEQALDAVGLAGLAARSIGTLSGGQLQRARFARLLLQDAPLMLLDEPYAAVDASTVRDLATLVARWHAEGRTVISVLHDLEHVKKAYPETLLLAREPIAYGPTAEVLTEANLQHARLHAESISGLGVEAVCRQDNAIVTEKAA